MEKPTLPKGTRDFGPAQMARRQFIFNNIRAVFQKYGFQPLETPAMENLTTLTGKYGEEGDQLLFKILDSGEYYEKFKSKTEGRIQNALFDFMRSSLKDSFFKLLKPKTISQSNPIQNQYIDNLFFSTLNIEDEAPKIYDQNRSINLSKSAELLTKTDRSILDRFTLDKREEIINRIIAFLKMHRFEGKNYSEFDNHFSTQSQFFRDHIVHRVSELFNSSMLTSEISEKGLRYDLTVPFARYVVMNRGEITFPFKRYQMQPVWRADRPQKGRYREFYQCDADVVGTDSLICEAEIILMIKEVFTALGIADYTIKVNHRGILSGLAELTGTTNETALFVAIDKLDKIGEEKVREELAGKGFTTESLNTVFEILNFKGTTAEKIQLLTERFTTSASGARGITDFRAVLHLLADYGVNEEHVEFDIALARGLSYYTGCIFEVKINKVAMGSVSGGGRYDNLTQAFGIKERLSGVGISFGIDRIYDCMDELKLFPESAQATSKVLICHFDEESKRYGLKVLSTLRHSGIASEIYPDTVKINKQLDYANRKSIPYTLVIGSDEVKSGVLTFKDMKKGEQSKYSMEEIVNKLTADN